MITLITGAPGNGKTALAVAMLLEERGARPLFVSGIQELKIEHQPTPPVDDWTKEVPTLEDPNFTEHVFTFPPHSIIVIDEAQKLYRPRASSSKVPPYVAAFETHRHTGVDFWLITQHPGLLDSNIKKLVGRHVHIRSTPLGRYLYEWPECGDPDTKTSRQLSASRRYKLPKKVFGLYKSATVHLKHRFRIPVAVYLLIVALVIAAILGYFMYKRYRDITDAPSPLPGATGSPAAPGASSPNLGSPVPPGQGKPQLTPQQYVQSLEPRLHQLAHTAPVYDEITRPTRVPVPAGCVSTPTRCQCYTQDATPYAVDESLCRQVVKGGLFLAFEPEGQRKAAEQGGLRARDASAASGPGPQALPAAHALVTTPYELPSQ